MKTTEFSALDDDNHEIAFSMHAEKRPRSQQQSANHPDFSQPATTASDHIAATDANMKIKKPHSKRLTNCPACEGIVSRRAHFCPHCGEPDPSRHMQRSQWVSRVIWTVIIVTAGWYIYTDLVPLIIDRLKG